MVNFSLEGKVALVTGASYGIGFAIAGGSDRGEQRPQGGGADIRAGPGKDSKGGDDGLLCDEPGDEGSGDPPIGKAQRSEERGDPGTHGGQQTVGAVIHQVQPGVKGLEEPDDDGGHEDDGEGSGQKILGLVPAQLPHAFGGGEAVVGQLHDEGHGVALVDCGAQHLGRHDAHQDTQDVQPDHHQGGMIREKGGGKHAVDGDLGRAAHEGRQQDGHPSVPLRGQCPGGHDGGH